LIRRIAPAIALFFVAPLVAEYLLGDIPLSHPIALVFLAPIYGGGALLIREIVRRTGRGWPSIVVLALAYGILEESFMTQTLFNPNYLGKNFHLLDHAYIPALGMGAWWTVFVLTLHTVWSISVPICLVESLVPKRAREPWLRNVGLGVVAVLFIWIGIASAIFSVRQDKAHFVASVAQFTWAGVFFVVAATAAFLLPKSDVIRGTGTAPNAWTIGAFALITSSLVLLIPPAWGWWAFAAEVGVEIIAVLVIIYWSRLAGWGMPHRLGLAGGAGLSYAWHGFVQHPVMGSGGLSMRIGNAVLALGLIAFLTVAGRRVRSCAIETSGDHGQTPAAG
jgi:hypothetical protein